MAHFTSTNDKPYDKHIYELHFTDGTVQVWDDYTQLRDTWVACGGRGMKRVEVKDPAVPRGFK